MINFEWPLEELQAYKPLQTAQEDFDAFWKSELEASAQVPLDSQIYKREYPIEQVEVFDISYKGADGNKVDGLWIKPAHHEGKLPALIYYHGYTRSKGFVEDYLKWVIQGYSVLAISVRGQGGHTGNPGPFSGGGVTGWMTMGIQSKETYYYKQIYLDGVRAIDFLSSQEVVDPGKIGIYGLSQGGGIALAVAGLDHRIQFVMPIYPYLCHFKRGMEAYTDGPYSELFEYFRAFDPQMKSQDQVFKTLSYFDGMNFASRISCPVLMAVGLVDNVCPPSTIYAAYNHILGDKEMRVYPHHGHESLPFHDFEMITFVKKYF